MKIAVGIDKKLGICDIETLLELFDVGIYNPDSKEWQEFEVSAYKNELYEFVKAYNSKGYDYLVTFNGIAFDHQVMEWVVENHQKWFDLTNLEICAKIHTFAQELIDNSNYGLFLPYKEQKFQIRPLDVFRIHHFDNEARRTSLKWCAFMLNMDVEEMPIKHNTTGLSKEDVEVVRAYRRNDVRVTEGVLRLTLGDIDLPELKDYKGKNKIQDRFDVMNETGMPCLNWSDVKIGEEWNKLNYMKNMGIQDERKLFPEKVIHPYGKRFKQFFPKTAVFETELLQKFTKSLGNSFVLAEKQEFPITVGQTTYTIAKGGLHSNEKNRIVKAPVGWNYRSADVGGQYPGFIIKNRIRPPHLTEAIVDIADYNVDRRITLKAEAQKLEKEGKTEEARPKKGIVEMLKLCNNGGLFGKLGQKGSFLEYPYGLLQVCMGNEIEILMLIEKMEQAGFRVISGNTDGIDTLYPQDKEELYMTICRDWEQRVGNVKNGKLEFTDFVLMAQESVNSYIGKKVDGKVKKKGRFMTEFELNKNKSMRIVPLALEAYFIEGKDPEEFIMKHSNIFDFCIAKKASGKMHYEEQWTEEKVIKTKVHKKLVRYFLSKKGTILYKRGFNNEGNPMNNHVNAPTDLGQPLITYFNKAYKAENYGVDYDHYILEVLERMDKIEGTRKAEAFIDRRNPGQQLSLF